MPGFPPHADCAGSDESSGPAPWTASRNAAGGNAEYGEDQDDRRAGKHAPTAETLTGRFRHNPPRVWTRAQHLPHFLLHWPHNGTHNARRGKDRVGLLYRVIQSKQTGQHVRFGVFRGRAVGKGKVEPPQEKHPACLLRVEAPRAPHLGQILVVGPYYEWLSGSLQPVSPLLQRQNHRQELAVSHMLAALRQRQPPTEEAAGVQFPGLMGSARRGPPRHQHLRHPPLL